MNLFYVPEINAEQVKLPDEEARHCINVLRYRIGQQVELTDGKGYLYKGAIKELNKRSVSIKIKEKQAVSTSRDYRIHIAIAPTKNMDRFEWFLEKSTEIGIDEITPLLTHHSERRKLREDRLEKTVIAAMKQSLKTHKPQINELCSLESFLNKEKSADQKFIAYCGKFEKKFFATAYQKGSSLVIIIGPEGDFTEEEVRLATKYGYCVVSLGESRLRTETAGIVACHGVYLLNQ